MSTNSNNHDATTTKKNSLFDYSEEELLTDHVLNHYEILNIPEYASRDDVKKAYRKASLKYHPDKTGRGENDYVFLAVKAAHDTLYDPEKRQAYDSTTMPFDDWIPAGGQTYTEEDFFATFTPVFQRNLRFDSNLRPEHSGNNNNNKKGRKPSATNGTKTSSASAPSLGNNDTPIEQVQEFYSYWTHFDSWRDFSQIAAEELQIEMDGVESRYEKRWLQKEIDKRAKQLKRKELARIQTLVERAMEADPRLRRDRQARQAAKEEAARLRQEKIELEKKLEDERKKAEEEELEREKERKAEEKQQREIEKKMIRKERQTLRRMASSSFTELSDEIPDDLWKDAYDMNVDVELLCTSLSLEELRVLNKDLEQKRGALEMLLSVQKRVESVKSGQEPQATKPATKDENEVRKLADCTRDKSISNNLPWTKEDLSALAKGVKKYPPGGAMRWEQIAMFVNNLCKPETPRTKEECIEKYNAVTRGVKLASVNTNVSNETPDTSTNVDPPKGVDETDDVWTPEQDLQLQEGLSKFPATMDKNERWASIAKLVSGKSKKQCVQRFKAIRELLQSRK